MRLRDLTAYLDDYLRVRDVPDAPEALNGLQVANAGEITRVAAAVDLCEATVRLATEARADLLLVHHGLFWGGRSEEHTSELQSRPHLVCRLLLGKKKDTHGPRTRRAALASQTRT